MVVFYFEFLVYSSVGFTSHSKETKNRINIGLWFLVIFLKILGNYIKELVCAIWLQVTVIVLKTHKLSSNTVALTLTISPVNCCSF